MRYKVIFNLPGKNEATEVLIEKEKMKPLLEAINQKKVVQIGEGFYNTAYFVNAVPDKNQMKLDHDQQQALSATRKKYLGNDSMEQSKSELMHA